jgi:predicted secreted protein
VQDVSPGGEITVKPDQEFRVVFRSRGSAGYTWTMNVPGFISAYDYTQEPIENLGVGGFPQVSYTCQCMEPGEFVIRFHEHRPWDPSSRIDGDIKVHCIE